MIDSFKPFLERIFKELSKLKLDISCYELDHIGYQSSSSKEYLALKKEFKKIGSLVSEEIVGGRYVSIYELNNHYVYENYTISAIELVEPKSNQKCKSSFEHVEFVINETYESLMNKYPTFEWDKSSVNRPKFSMLKLRLDDEIQVKFHLKNILEIVKGNK